MSVPLLRCLTSDPGKPVELSIATKSESEGDIVRLALAKQAITVLPLHQYRQRYLNVLAYIRNLRQIQPDVFLPIYGVHANLPALIAYLSGARVRVGVGDGLGSIANNRRIVFPPGHKVRKNLELAKALGFRVPREPDLRIAAPASARTAISIWLKERNTGARRLVVLAPGSGQVEAHKRWPATRFGELASMLVEALDDIQVIVTGTAQERQLGHEIVLNFTGPKDLLLNTSGTLSVLETLALFERASILVTNCNGASHLAAAAGCPILGLYGPTDPMVTGAFSRKLHMVSDNLECSPCYSSDYTTGCGNPVCMNQLSTQKVFDDAISLLC